MCRHHYVQISHLHGLWYKYIVLYSAAPRLGFGLIFISALTCHLDYNVATFKNALYLEVLLVKEIVRIADKHFKSIMECSCNTGFSIVVPRSWEQPA
jgi:hypothetical protein